MSIHVLERTAAPAAAPTKVGQHWINTSTGEQWLASGTATVADWIALEDVVAVWGGITGVLSNQTDLQAALDAKVDENVSITGATKTKITYDAKGLVTSGADATTADIADSLNKRYVTDADLVDIGNLSGTNTGDQDLSGLVPYVGATANLNLGSAFKTINALDPTAAQDYATKNYADTKAGGIAKTATIVATAGAINNLAISTGWIRFTGAAVVLSGLDATGIADGTEITLYNANTGSGNEVKVLGASALSLVANRFTAAFTIGLRQAVKIRYNLASTIWEVAIPANSWAEQGSRLPTGSYYLGTLAGATTDISGVVDGNLWSYLNSTTRQYFSDSNIVAMDISQNIRKLYNSTDTTNPTINFENCTLYGIASAIPSVDWNNRLLYDSAGATILNWVGTDITISTNVQMPSYEISANILRGNSLSNQFGQPLIDTATFAYYDGSAVTAINMTNRQLLESNGSYVAIDWAGTSKGLYDIGVSNSGPMLGWGVGYGNSVRIYEGTNPNLVADFGLFTLYDNTLSASIDFNYHLLQTSGLTSVDWQNRTLNESSGSTTLDWQNFYLVHNGLVSVDWANRELFDSTPVLSLSYEARTLYNSINTLMLDWSTSGTLAIGAGAAAVTFQSGTAAIPSITFSGDTNTGIYRSASDTLDFTTGGTNRLSISGGAISGNLPIRATGTTAGAPAFAGAADTNTGMFLANSDVLGFSTGGTERMRFYAAGQINCVAVAAPASPVNGDIWVDSTQKAVQSFESGIKQTLGGVIFVLTTTGTAANTTAETTISSTGVGTLTLPANFFVVGKKISITGFGIHSGTASPDITVKIKLGSTVVLTTGLVATGNSTNTGFNVNGDMICRTTGALGTLMGAGNYIETDASPKNYGMVNTTTTTIDTTVSQAITVTAQYSAANAANTISLQDLVVEVLN